MSIYGVCTCSINKLAVRSQCYTLPSSCTYLFRYLFALAGKLNTQEATPHVRSTREEAFLYRLNEVLFPFSSI